MSALEVNECRLNGVGGEARAWWLSYRQSLHRTDRMTTVKATVGGDVVRVACDDADDATRLMRHLERVGVPSSAMRVVKS